MNEQIEKQAIEEMAEYIYGNGITHDTAFHEDCRSIARDLYSANYRKQEWISVEERLPDRSGRFLVYAKYTYYAGISIINYTPKYTFGEESLMGRAVWFSHDSEWGDYEIKEVTHWMPLPELPKMKGGAE